VFETTGDAPETFLSVFRSIEAYRREASLVSWNRRIARSTLNHHIGNRRATFSGLAGGVR
jgi:DNA-directed RNA polymerase specialized sigma24 family protein